MNSRIASNEKIHFRDRLVTVLRRASVTVRASSVAREFNLRADGAAVTTHAVRKWLTGDSIPTHERLLILADWLGVHASWLRYGDAENMDFAFSQKPASFDTSDLILIRDFNRLNDDGQRVLRGVLDVLLTSMVSELHTPSQRQGK
jgi:transcriptional regulator with XRE-family HTH domain